MLKNVFFNDLLWQGTSDRSKTPDFHISLSDRDQSGSFRPGLFLDTFLCRSQIRTEGSAATKALGLILFSFFFSRSFLAL